MVVFNEKRFELPRIFFTFYNEIFVQFNKRIKILQSDNTLEYTQLVVDSFCVDRGIIHQTSCPRTSQQNGVVERKHRHLLDVARTLLFHMHVPKHFWGDAVLTACRLINRMPSVFLNNKSLFSLLYPDCAPFLLTPRLFGCVAFVHVLDHDCDKLSPRARKCIFLGYSCTQKGYRCFSPESRQYYISANVTFF
jgi:transposase InsO family protein